MAMPSKKEIIEMVSGKIDRWKVDADRLQAHADRVAGPDLRHYSATVKEILAKIQQVENQFTDLSDSNIETWRQLIESAETADKHINDRLKWARRKFLP
jgi:DNA repair ATPase RecN